MRGRLLISHDFQKEDDLHEKEFRKDTPVDKETFST